MLRIFTLLLIATGCGCVAQTQSQAASVSSTGARLGFSSVALSQERKAEAAFTAQLSIDSISSLHREVTKRPHMAGTPASMAVAELIRKKLEDAGLETEVQEFDVYLSTPR